MSNERPRDSHADLCGCPAGRRGHEGSAEGERSEASTQAQESNARGGNHAGTDNAQGSSLEGR